MELLRAVSDYSFGWFLQSFPNFTFLSELNKIYFIFVNKAKIHISKKKAGYLATIANSLFFALFF